MNYIAILLLVLLAFTIGLNLGLHGVMDFHFSFAPYVRKEVQSEKTNSSASEITHKVTESVISKQSEGTLVPISKVGLTNEAESGKTVKPTAITRIQKVLDEAIEEALAADSEYKQAVLTTPEPDIPVILLTYNRPELLDITLQSLLTTVVGLPKNLIYILQDGQDESVMKVCQKYGLNVHQNRRNLRIRDGGARIAQHYKYSLSTAFSTLFPKAPALIVIEDDLLFAPDFYVYLTTGFREVYAKDPTHTFVMSAWNDNGFREHLPPSSSAPLPLTPPFLAPPSPPLQTALSPEEHTYVLKRTTYFPGLGWILSRQLWEQELSARWPGEHWDHWMRSEPVHKNREIVYPEIPRTYHNGIKGTFMTLGTHNKYFKDIALQPHFHVDWSSAAAKRSVFAVKKRAYESRVAALLKRCRHVSSPSALVAEGAAGVGEGEVVCVWVSVSPDTTPPAPFTALSDLFHLWHEFYRGDYYGVKEFYFFNRYVVLVNVHPEVRTGGLDWQTHMPSHISPFTLPSYNPLPNPELERVLMRLKERQTAP
eukprot:gene35317-42795_t